MCKCQLAYQDVLGSVSFHICSVIQCISLVQCSFFYLCRHTICRFLSLHSLTLSSSPSSPRLPFPIFRRSCISVHVLHLVPLYSFIYCVYESKWKMLTVITGWKKKEHQQIINHKSCGSNVERVKVHWILKTIGVVFIFFLPLNFMFCVRECISCLLMNHEIHTTIKLQRKTKGSVSVLYFNR